MRGASALLPFTLYLLLTGVHPCAWAADQKIVIGGAQSLAPLAEKFSERFRKQHPGIDIEIRYGGSSYAIQAVNRGEIAIGLVTRNLDPEEKSGLQVEPVGHDAIVLLSYPESPLKGLTLAQLQAIYLGKVSSWKELGGEDKGIVALTREKNSTIHGTFVQDLFGPKFDGQEKAFTIRASKEKILKTIKRIAGAIGYGIVRLDEARSQGVKVLAINGKLPTEANIIQGTYPFPRPQYLVLAPNPPDVVRQWAAEFARFAGQEPVD